MKKLLLSSVIMFGVCSFVTAQSATTDSKFKKAQTQTSTAVIAPQISASTAQAATSSKVDSPIDKAPVTVNDAGVATKEAVHPDVKKKRQIRQQQEQKIAADKAKSNN